MQRGEDPGGGSGASKPPDAENPEPFPAELVKGDKKERKKQRHRSPSSSSSSSSSSSDSSSGSSSSSTSTWTDSSISSRECSKLDAGAGKQPGGERPKNSGTPSSRGTRSHSKRAHQPASRSTLSKEYHADEDDGQGQEKKQKKLFWGAKRVEEPGKEGQGGSGSGSNQLPTSTSETTLAAKGSQGEEEEEEPVPPQNFGRNGRPVIDFLREHFNCENPNALNELLTTKTNDVLEALRGRKVATAHAKQQTIFPVEEVTKEGADRIPAFRHKHNSPSVADHYRNIHVKLEHPEWPCLVHLQGYVNKKKVGTYGERHRNYFPIEVMFLRH